jgi:hypothetical protein
MKNVLKIAAGLYLLLLFCNTIKAQQLVSTISQNAANLNTSESQRYLNLQQDEFTKDLKLVNFGNPRDFVNADGNLLFEFPGILGTIEAEAIDIGTTDTSYSWTGRLLNHTGYFGFYEISNHRAAWLQIDTRFFEIMPIRPGICTVREIESDIQDTGGCIHPPAEQTPRSENRLCDTDYNTCPATIDILVLLPPDATQWLQTKFGNNWLAKALYVGIGTQALNTAYINSDIPNKRANFLLENFDMQYPNGTNCGILLNALVTQATARRNAVGADLVVLLTANKDYDCGSGAACAELGDPPNFCDPGFTFSEIWWLINPRWSMLHEVGHLTGAGHDRISDPDSDCAHGWTVGNNRFQRTLMASWFGSQNPTDIRILHYSNPDVAFNGDPTGTQDDNNAKVIRNGACEVANYRASKNFNAQIKTKPWVCRAEEYIYVDAIVQEPTPFNPGQPPYTYEWKWSGNGDFSGANGVWFGNTQSSSFLIPEDGQQVWIRLKVTSIDGITITSIKKVLTYFDSHPKCSGGRGLSSGVQHIQITASELSIRPNPANAEAEIRWAASNEQEVTLNLLDFAGRSIREYNTRQRIGENFIKIGLHELPSGVYGIVLRSGGSAKFQKLFVNH